MAKPTSRKQSLRQRLSFNPQSLARKGTARWTVLVLAAFLVLESFFFDTILSNNNYVEIFPSGLLFPSFMHLCTALIAGTAVTLCKFPRTLGAKLVSVIILTLSLVDYDERFLKVRDLFAAFFPILPGANQDALISLLFLLSLFALAIGVGVLFERLQARYVQLQAGNAVYALFILIGVLSFSQIISLLSMVPTLARQSSVAAPTFSSTNKPPSDKPDIFYIVFDRYTNANVLQQQFTYDNSPFTGYLRNQGFTVNDDAYANYPYTTMSVSSTLNAQYTNKLVAPFRDDNVQSRTLYHNLIRQSSVIKALTANGYTYHAIGTGYGATNKAPLASSDHIADRSIKLFGKYKVLRDFEGIELINSPYYRFGKVSDASWWPLKIHNQEQTQEVQQQLQVLNNLTTKDAPGGRFVFAHILVPHDPFLFNADGSLSTYPTSDSIGRPIKDKYLNQVQFINAQTQQLVDNIQKQSGSKAIIVINADEGAYPNIMNSTFLNPIAAAPGGEGNAVGGDMRTWTDDWLRMKYGVLQAVHIPQATEDDLAHLSSVNIFRIILNRYAGLSLPYLPDCHYALTDPLRDYIHVDITKRLKGQDNAECKQYESLPTASKK